MSARYALGCVAVLMWLAMTACTTSVPQKHLSYSLTNDRFDGQNSLDIELSQGVGGTTKSDPLKSRAGADGKFSKIVFDYEYGCHFSAP